MTKITTEQENNQPVSGPKKDKEQSRSVLNRVSKWLTNKKQKTDETDSPVPAPAEAGQEIYLTEETKPFPVSGNSAATETKGEPQTMTRSSSNIGTSFPGKSEQKTKANPQKKGRSSQKPAKKTAPVPKRRQQSTAGGGKDSGAKRTTKKSKPKSSPGYKLLINTDEPEECRIVLLEDGKVESFHVETVSRIQTKGNIYKGRITAVEPNLQAAFVDIGAEKNGFLAFSEIHPEYYCKPVEPDTHWKGLNIQDVIRKGQGVLVEVVKEATGTKGANMTTYLSLPGRYLVLMPGSDSAGTSRKIDNEAHRAKLRKMVNNLKRPEGIGYIIRTASKDITKTALSQDMRFLLNLWMKIKKRGQKMSAPSLIYKEQNIISRFLRDHYTTDINEIMVDNEEAYGQVANFLELLPAVQRKKTSVKQHTGAQPIFYQYHVEKQIEQIYQPTVPLPSGGSIVINPTEALVAIDVNSGRTAKDKNFEETVFLANMEAAEELTRQLRLRDLGGLIVVDFIDMRDSHHVREVEKQVKECMKRDKAKVDFTRISKFGLMQISRQKMASPVEMGSYKICEHCQGRGMVRSVETLALAHLRHIQTGISKGNVKKAVCRLPIEVAQYILNKKREELLGFEERYDVTILIEMDPVMKPSEKEIEFVKG